MEEEEEEVVAVVVVVAAWHPIATLAVAEAAVMGASAGAQRLKKETVFRIKSNCH